MSLFRASYYLGNFFFIKKETEVNPYQFITLIDWKQVVQTISDEHVS